ncbi:MAG TPA: type II toxin-antitoxin system RelE/ParE family toxin [Solirubrobacterales bacterium]|nr:type II toxin-antitoxin system RelE/ParE family toxin [Solirubrobacterales bacterium]
MARLVLARRARRDLLDLDWPLIDAIEDALAMLEREPFAGYPLRGKLRGLYSLRVGSYRILYQLTDGGKTVRVAAIRHRSISYGTDPR